MADNYQNKSEHIVLETNSEAHKLFVRWSPEAFNYKLIALFLISYIIIVGLLFHPLNGKKGYAPEESYMEPEYVFSKEKATQEVTSVNGFLSFGVDKKAISDTALLSGSDLFLCGILLFFFALFYDMIYLVNRAIGYITYRNYLHALNKHSGTLL